MVYASKTPAKGSKKARRSSVATTQPYKLVLDGVNYLDADVTVQPAAKWESLKRYRKLTGKNTHTHTHIHPDARKRFRTAQ